MPSKREDKIFNNSYYHGNKNATAENYRYDNKIEADQESILNQTTGSSSEPDTQYPYKEIEKIIMDLVDENIEIQDILKNNKKKFNKQKINNLFEIILEHFNSTIELRRIRIHIYIFDVISRLTGIKTSNLFDLLDFDYKQLLLNELDESFSIYNEFNKEHKYF